MDFRGVRALIVVAATMALLALTAGAVAQSAAAAPKKAPSAKQFKALQKLTKGLIAKVAALEAKTEALQARKAPVPAVVAAPPALAVPATLPPSGPAGGSLEGTYPKPRLALNTVTGAELAEHAVHTSDLAEGSVDSAALANHSIAPADLGDRSVTPPAFVAGAVTAPALGAVFPVAGSGVEVTQGQTKRATVSCPAGTRLLSGGYAWTSFANSNDTVMMSSPIFPGPISPEDPATSWQVIARATTGPANTISAVALCLN